MFRNYIMLQEIKKGIERGEDNTILRLQSSE